MKRKITQGAVILFAGAAAAMNACSSSTETDDAGAGGLGGGAGETSSGGMPGDGGAPTSTGGSSTGGAKATGGVNGGGMGGLGGLGGAGTGGTGGVVLTPEEELALATAEATSRCEGLSGWQTVTWLTVDADNYSTANETSELVHGLPGDDSISLSWGTFCALGGKGDDTINFVAGAMANTSVTGGDGADTFQFSFTDLADRNLYFTDFKPGEDKFVFPATGVKIDTVTKIETTASFNPATVTSYSTPFDAYRVIVVPGASTGEIWLANNNEGVQTNYRIGYIANYTTYSASDFVFE